MQPSTFGCFWCNHVLKRGKKEGAILYTIDHHIYVYIHIPRMSMFSIDWIRLACLETQQSGCRNPDDLCSILSQTFRHLFLKPFAMWRFSFAACMCLKYTFAENPVSGFTMVCTRNLQIFPLDCDHPPIHLG